MPKPRNDTSNPAIERDVRSMERKARVNEVLGDKPFRSELEDMVISQKDGNKPMFHSGIKISNSTSSFGSVDFKGAANTRQVNDLAGALRDKYSKSERDLRCKLAALYRLTAFFEWDHLIYSHITARLPGNEEHYLINPYGMQYSEVTASSLIKVDIEGNIVDGGSTVLPVNKAGFKLNSALHKAGRNVVYHTHSHAGTAISAMKCGLLNLCQEALIVRPVSYGSYQGFVPNEEEQQQLVDDMMDNSNVMILVNHGLVSTGETIEETFLWMAQLTKACEIQWRVLRHGDIARSMSEDVVKEYPEGSLPVELTVNPNGCEYGPGELEFESYMRKLDNEGNNTGYPYKSPALFKDQIPTYHAVQYPPIVPGMEGPPSDTERARPVSTAQRSAWFKNTASPEQRISPPPDPTDKWNKPKPESSKDKKNRGPKQFATFDSVLQSTSSHSLSSADIGAPIVDFGKSPRMREIERELEKIQRQYTSKPRKSKSVSSESSTEDKVSNPSSDGKRPDIADVESVSDHSIKSIEMVEVDMGDDNVPTVDMGNVEVKEDVPTVQAEIFEPVEKSDKRVPLKSDVTRPDGTKEGKQASPKGSYVDSDTDYSEDVMMGVQDDILEIEQMLVINTDDAFTGMSEDSERPVLPDIQIPYLSRDITVDAKMSCATEIETQHDVQKEVEVRIGEDGVEVQDEITQHTVTTSIIEILEVQEEEFEVITIKPGQLTDEQKDELIRQGYVLQEE